MSPQTSSRWGRRRRAGVPVVALVTVALLLGACGVEASESGGGFDPNANQLESNGGDVIGSDAQVDTTEPEVTPTTAVPPEDPGIDGATNPDVTPIVANAILDIAAFWETAYPEAYEGEPYEPLSGGVWAIDSQSEPDDKPCGLPPDITEALQNAFYCPSDDAVIYDQEGLMPDLASRYGDFTVAVVLAHEWGHVIQQRAEEVDPDLASEPTVVTELQADCFAGAWSRHLQVDENARFDINTQIIDDALAGILSLRDAPGASADDPRAHGSGFDRVGAFQEGFEQGVTRCAEFTTGDPQPFQFEFTSETDLANQGNLPLQTGDPDAPGILDLLQDSLDLYWEDTFPEISGGEAWDPLGEPVAFEEGAPPTCNGEEVTSFRLFVCIPDRYVGYDIGVAIPEAYEQNGDYSVATLIATQYGLDVLDQLGEIPDDEVTATLRSDCFAGSYTSGIFADEDIPEDYPLILSPGDLDEAVSVLLASRSEGDRQRQGPGFDRVRAFRAGFLDGAEVCSTIEPS